MNKEQFKAILAVLSLAVLFFSFGMVTAVRRAENGLIRQLNTLQDAVLFEDGSWMVTQHDGTILKGCLAGRICESD